MEIGGIYESLSDDRKQASQEIIKRVKKQLKSNEEIIEAYVKKEYTKDFLYLTLRLDKDDVFLSIDSRSDVVLIKTKPSDWETIPLSIFEGKNNAATSTRYINKLYRALGAIRRRKKRNSRAN